MKTKVLLLSALLASPLYAQDATVIEDDSARTAAEAEQAKQRVLKAEERAKAALEKKPIVYGGFLPELSRAERKAKLLSLRQARDAKNDFKNLHYDEKTDRPKGFVLFSIGF